jgi:hypothetical protein
MTILAIAGCGGAAKTVTRTIAAQKTLATVTRTQAGRAYLAAVGPEDAAARVFAAKTRTWTTATTAKEAVADARPLVEALYSDRNKLLALAKEYPPGAQDLKSQIVAGAPFLGDLNGVGAAASAGTLSSWLQTYASDLSEANAAAAITRSDLGLPPPPTS